MTEHHISGRTHDVLLIGVYDDETKAQAVVERLIEKGFPMDMLSVLGRAHPSGDDVLGIYYTGPGARMKAWAKQGALWGALWGALTGAAAFFVIPGVGPLLAVGPVADMIVSVLSGGVVGAAAGSALGSAAMTGASAVTHLAVVLHRMGIPTETLDHLHREIEQGRYVLLLREAPDRLEPWKAVLGMSGAHELLELPYPGVRNIG